MGLLEDMRSIRIVKGPACLTGVQFSKLSKVEVDDIRKAYFEEAIPMSIVYSVLKNKKKLDIKLQGLRRHLKGECRCGTF